MLNLICVVQKTDTSKIFKNLLSFVWVSLAANVYPLPVCGSNNWRLYSVFDFIAYEIFLVNNLLKCMQRLLQIFVKSSILLDPQDLSSIGRAVF